ncbi:MAG: SpoIID/LytB domain-containing protein [Clostridiales bacterium]|nr:SpoIID/LytB domain-containing protein [Clostridiales bacterium]
MRLFLLLLFCVVLSLEVGYLTNKSAEQEKREEERVLTAELAGYLQLLSFSPAETRAWLLTDMGTYLTGADVDLILDFLELDSFAETLHAEVSFEDEEELSRRKWCVIYEEMAEYLGMSDQVQVVTIQYLGMLADENRVMADSGNYDCDPASVNFVYGETYEVYISGNLLLGLRAGTEEAEADGTASEEPDMFIEVSVPDTVRVLLTQDNNESVYRDNVRIKGSQPLQISGGDHTYEADADDVTECASLMDEWEVNELVAEASEDGKICVVNEEGSAVSSWYRGSFHLYRNESGIWIVNEADLEEYLYGVVPGEMPESFAGEALKAQAVCARTYACYLVAKSGYAEYNADINDTTDCQVYLPSKENEKAAAAVEATRGMVLEYQGFLATIYYFSTSCGYTSGMEVWQAAEIPYLTGISLLSGADAYVAVSGEENDENGNEGALSSEEDGEEAGVDFDSFLRDTEVDAYDASSRYFRWEAKLDMASAQEEVKQALAAEQKKGSSKVALSDSAGETLIDTDGLGEYVTMSVAERNSSGVVTDLRIIFAGGFADVCHENTIRTILGLAMTELTDKNGDSVYTLDMLPSAAISLDCANDGTCRVYGGGLGHGIGMSQYGADGMARAGKSCEEILEKFFPGTEIGGVE